jgi:hypothetical protein
MPTISTSISSAARPPGADAHCRIVWHFDRDGNGAARGQQHSAA